MTRLGVENLGIRDPSNNCDRHLLFTCKVELNFSNFCGVAIYIYNVERSDEMLCETIDLQEFFRAVDFSSLVPCFFQSS